MYFVLYYFLCSVSHYLGLTILREGFIIYSRVEDTLVARLSHKRSTSVRSVIIPLSTEAEQTIMFFLSLRGLVKGLVWIDYTNPTYTNTTIQHNHNHHHQYYQHQQQQTLYHSEANKSIN